MRRILRLFAAPFLFVLKQPRLTAEIGIVFLVALVWFAGPWLGLESVDGRVQAIIGIVILRTIVYIVQYFVAQKRAANLEDSLRQQAHRDRADRGEEIEAVRVQFEKGLAALKESKVAKGRGGKTALYALPWYMFIGPPASGKSTALRHSGLQFPALTGSGQGLQGLGGTRNCDWWFTNGGILLDTAGRYVTQEEDQAEWLAFLDLLKKYRKHTPINGVIATISIADLLQGSDEEVEAHAKQMRARIDELITRLGIVFPVYVMFTKCDLVQGFVEFFEELNRADRERIWGCTYARSAESSEPHSVRFQKEFDDLMSALQQRRLMRLANTRGSHKITIFSFPMQMASSRDRLARFIDLLFQKNAYQESPLFRGFYFTSGTQEGTPIDRILGAVSRASGLSDVSVSSIAPAEPKSYFLKELFADIIFQDHQLVTPSSTIYRQRGYLRVGVFVLSVLFVVIAMTGLAVSFIGNKRLLSGALSDAVRPPQLGLDQAHIGKSAEYLDDLGGRLQKILEYDRRGVPLRLRGFYRGDRIQEEVEGIYLRYFSNLLLTETKRDMEGQLAGYTLAYQTKGGAEPEEYDEYYSLLKAYIMLGDPTHLQPAYLHRWLDEYWTIRLKDIYQNQEVPAEVLQQILGQLRLYSEYLARKNGSRMVLNVRLIRDVQEVLRKLPRVQRIYALSLRESEEFVKPFTVDMVLQGSQQGAVLSDYAIPGIFTLSGWKGPFQASVAKVLEDLAGEGWVIGEPEVERAELDKSIKRLYFGDYVRHWKQFARSLRIKQAVTPANVEETLSVLALADSPIYRTIEAVHRNTTLVETEAASKLQHTAASLLEKVKKSIGIEGTPEQAVSQRETEELLKRLGNPGDFSSSVSPRFKAFQQLLRVAKDEKEEPPLLKYLAELRKIHQTIRPVLRAETPAADIKALAKTIVAGEPNDLLQAVKNADLLLQKLDPESTEGMTVLFIEPLMMSMRGIVERAKMEAAKRWEAEIYPTCARNVEGHFPFRLVGGDAPMADLAEVFHPDNGSLWKFYQAELKPFVTEGVELWEAKQWATIHMDLSKEFLDSLSHGRLMSESLFPKGSGDAAAAFELYPYPPLGGVRSVTEIRLEIGGQPLRYRMEPQEWHDMKWPGPTPLLGALLQVQVGGTWVTKEYKDWWGLFRLIQAGRLTPTVGETQYRIQWDLPTADGTAIKVQYDLRAPTHKNPFRPGLFEQFRCVEHL
jgi:type VI secretion system protein ImpL